jgi:drug/metabolite transporter (DMT)-like permease
MLWALIKHLVLFPAAVCLGLMSAVAVTNLIIYTPTRDYFPPSLAVTVWAIYTAIVAYVAAAATFFVLRRRKRRTPAADVALPSFSVSVLAATAVAVALSVYFQNHL